MEIDLEQIFVFCKNMDLQYQMMTEQLQQLKLQVSIVQATIDKRCRCTGKENKDSRALVHGADLDQLVHFTHQMEQLSCDLRSVTMEGSKEQRYLGYLHEKLKMSTVLPVQNCATSQNGSTTQYSTTWQHRATLQHRATMQCSTNWQHRDTSQYRTTPPHRATSQHRATPQHSATLQYGTTSVLQEDIVASVNKLLEEDERICRLREEVENNINKANRQIAKIQASLSQSSTCDVVIAESDKKYMDNFVKQHLNLKRFPLQNRNTKQ